MKANTTCRSCRAPVRWCITAATGKRMPVDPDPVPDGNIFVHHIEGGTPIIEVTLSHDEVPRSVPFTYVSHFVTCPAADSWRKQ